MIHELFFDYNNDFQWASIAAIIAGIGAITSVVFSVLGYKNSKKSLEQQNIIEQKKIDADIISKSRMHWIDNTKVLVTRFVTNTLELGAHYVMFNEKVLQYRGKLLDVDNKKKASVNKLLTKQQRQEANEEVEDWKNRGSEIFNNDMIKRVDLINNLLKTVAQDSILIKLNFSENEENNKIVSLSEEIYEELRKFSLQNGWSQFAPPSELTSAIERAKKIRDSNAKKIKKLSNILRTYYKIEWEKVKSGK